MFERPPFSKADETRILDAIVEAEKGTSGEIRIHVEQHCKKPVYDEAVAVFERLGMTKTKERNGVLILVALADHKFAIIGDEGINSKVPTGFWEETKNLMIEHFKKGNIVDGIIEGILDVGQQLKIYFPIKADDQNELKNDISYGKN